MPQLQVVFFLSIFSAVKETKKNKFWLGGIQLGSA
jgi:hypothetical protein